MVRYSAFGVHVNSKGFYVMLVVFRPFIIVHMSLFTIVLLCVYGPVIVSNVPQLNSLGNTMYKPSLSILNSA